MNRLQVLRWCGMGLLGIFLAVSTGFAAAAKWANPELLVTADQVKKNIKKSNWVVVDCRSAKDYAKGHIPGAISIGKKSCKKTLRDATARVFRDTKKYEKLLGKVGIGNNTHVVFYYDGLKTMNDATVAFWVMEYLGHKKTHVLNGGLEAWRKGGNRLDKKPVIKKKTTYKAKVENSRYASTDEILGIAKGKTKGTQLIDSRTKKEYVGKDIRAVRGGHIPNVTLNKSHKDTLLMARDKKTGKMKATAWLDADAANKAFGKLDKSKRTIAYCQTGTRSTMTYLQLRLMGFKNPANWDDSWRVYGSNPDFPAADEQWFNFSKLNKTVKKLGKRLSKLEKK